MKKAFPNGGGPEHIVGRNICRQPAQPSQHICTQLGVQGQDRYLKSYTSIFKLVILLYLLHLCKVEERIGICKSCTSFTSNYPAFNLNRWNFINELHWRFLACILLQKNKCEFHKILSAIQCAEMI